MTRASRFAVLVNFGVIVVLAFWVFLAPVGILVHDLSDPALASGEIPRFVFRWHRGLSGKFERWARDRVASGQVVKLSKTDVAGTEWPMFGSVFYLWATEALQEAWEQDSTLAPAMPRTQGRGAIEAAAALIADPNHASWVKQHWGANYLEHDNLFYRSLLISGLTSFEKLTASSRYHDLLARQVESLAGEIDRSPHGLLDDYPGECYPIDVLPAIAAIRRADAVLGTDHASFAARAVRGFEEGRIDAGTGLPAYEVDSKTGRAVGPARGIGAAFMLTWAPGLWPETARAWYPRFEDHFWQQGFWLAGFREFPRGQTAGDWSIDVDAGPVLAGYGTAASAFGIGAARTNGRFDHAYPLSTLALAASWPLADGTLLSARLLSNLAEAPYLGESALLFVLSRRPAGQAASPQPGRLPGLVSLLLLFYAGAGVLILVAAARGLRRWFREGDPWIIPLPWLQFLVWFTLLVVGIAMILSDRVGWGLIPLLAAQLLPRGRRRIAEQPALGREPETLLPCR